MVRRKRKNPNKFVNYGFMSDCLTYEQGDTRKKKTKVTVVNIQDILLTAGDDKSTTIKHRQGKIKIPVPIESYMMVLLEHKTKIAERGLSSVTKGKVNNA